MSNIPTIQSDGLFETTPAAELMAEMLKSFLMDMAVDETSDKIRLNNLLVIKDLSATDIKDKGTVKDIDDKIRVINRDIIALQDIIRATAIILNEVNHYRKDPETPDELMQDLVLPGYRNADNLIQLLENMEPNRK